jgi:hypothetical protein
LSLKDKQRHALERQFSTRGTGSLSAPARIRHVQRSIKAPYLWRHPERQSVKNLQTLRTITDTKNQVFPMGRKERNLLLCCTWMSSSKCDRLCHPFSPRHAPSALSIDPRGMPPENLARIIHKIAASSCKSLFETVHVRNRPHNDFKQTAMRQDTHIVLPCARRCGNTLQAEFDGGPRSRDGGGLLRRATEAQGAIMRRFVKVRDDRRTPRYLDYSPEERLR